VVVSGIFCIWCFVACLDLRTAERPSFPSLSIYVYYIFIGTDCKRTIFLGKVRLAQRRFICVDHGGHFVICNSPAGYFLNMEMNKIKRTLVIELNEFNVRLLQQAAERFDLEHVKSVLSWSHCETHADHDKEHEGLDPWCQWVSIHTEIPSAFHKVIRLGDVDKLQYTQIWERLGKVGISTGVWGVMNARRNEAQLNHFFTTDPWNFTETPFPNTVAGFFALPVYFSKNYMDLVFSRTVKAAVITLFSIFKQLPFSDLWRDFVFLLRQIPGSKLNTCFLFGAFELLSTRLFLKLRKKYNPDVCIVFLNLIAHFQHHDWKSVEKIDDSSRAVFSFLNRILGLLLADSENERVIVLNAFTQKNVSQEAFFCYRQINPLEFLKRIGLRPTRVEQCMTNDGHAFFSTTEECLHAAACLREARVEGSAAFTIEIDESQPTRLFYQFAFWGAADSETTLNIGNKSMPLLSEFALHAKRTGAHVPLGSAFYNNLKLPHSTPNYEIFKYIWPR